MAMPTSPNHVFNFPANEPHDFDDSDLEFEEDPQEEFEEDPQGELEEDHEKSQRRLQMGSPKPPPPESSDSETKMTAEGDHVQRVAR
ncbi:hypothetical protein Tco_1509258 [Tanacetum coccineum]